MPLKIEFELHDDDLNRFRSQFEARQSKQIMTEHDILAATRKLVGEAIAGNPPSFIRERLKGLQELVDMAEDDAWKLPPDLRQPIISALSYFVNPDDLIPDHAVGFGYLDDAIAAELVLRELDDEIASYREFCSYRSDMLNQRKNRGESTDISKEDWLADRRAVLHSRLLDRIRDRRRGDDGWRFSVLGH